MATRKISSLTATTTVAGDDVVQVLDTSDTTFASTGTNKKIEVRDLAPELGGFTKTTDLMDTPSALGTAGQVLAVNSGATALEFVNQASGSGTVTSVDITAGTGITSSGGPITTSGSITVGLDAGFTDLNDTPATLSANQLVGVNSGGTALEYKTPIRELDDLTDVTISGTPTNGDVLTYDSGTSVFRPQAPSGGGGSNNIAKTFAFFDSNIRNVYIPMSNETETTSMQRYNRFICPVAGSVTSISFLLTLNLSGGTGGSIEVRKETTPGSYTTLETQSFSSVTAWTVTTLNFSSSSFSAGDRLLFFMNNGFSSAYSNVTGTILFSL